MPPRQLARSLFSHKWRQRCGIRHSLGPFGARNAESMVPTGHTAPHIAPRFRYHPRSEAGHQPSPPRRKLERVGSGRLVLSVLFYVLGGIKQH